MWQQRMLEISWDEGRWSAVVIDNRHKQKKKTKPNSGFCWLIQSPHCLPIEQINLSTRSTKTWLWLVLKAVIIGSTPKRIVTPGFVWGCWEKNSEFSPSVFSPCTVAWNLSIILTVLLCSMISESGLFALSLLSLIIWHESHTYNYGKVTVNMVNYGKYSKS